MQDVGSISGITRWAETVYSRATQLADRGPNPDFSSIDTGPQAPGLETACAATGCEKTFFRFTQLCSLVLSTELFSNKAGNFFAPSAQLHILSID